MSENENATDQHKSNPTSPNSNNTTIAPAAAEPTNPEEEEEPYISGFASNIYFPALPTIAHDLNVSIELINLTVTSYLIFQALAPSLWGPISDAKGRRVAYSCTFLVFLTACIGLAESKNYATLVVLRCLQSTGSASTIAIGSGVIGDITTRADRGGLMGIFQAGLLVPVAVGPVIGGALAGSLGWRSIFWFLTIYSGVFLVMLVVLLPETLRSIVGNGGRSPARLDWIARFPLNIYQKTTTTTTTSKLLSLEREGVASNPGARGKGKRGAKIDEKKHVDITAPLRILLSKQAAPIIIFLAIYYAVWQMSITAMSTLFATNYGLRETEIGLTFIANGVGSMIGTLITGKILDIDYRRIKARYQTDPESNSKSTNIPPNADSDGARRGSDGVKRDPDGTKRDSEGGERESDFPLEKARLRLVPVFAILQCASILLFGWTIEYPKRVHIAVPIISTFISGWTAVSTQSIVMTYLVDVFHDKSAGASASLNLARCLFAAGGTSFVMPLINAIGVGLTFSVCAAVQAVGLVGLIVQWKFGGRWRMEAESSSGRSKE
ncbi:hypothetical protein AA313_de0204760 [Arthrobotrys entomopaga]|nr:hypothetical protein AA313_de0204760 [Arthrobotrys entomopaga]